MKENFLRTNSGSREALKGLLIAIVLGYLSIFTGLYTIINYAVLIFLKAGTYIDPFVASIILAVMQILGCLCSTTFSDKFGRKILLIISSIGPAIGLSSISLYLYLVDYGYDLAAYAWIPIVCLSFVIFIASSGIFPLLSVCVIENLPPKVRH